MILEASAGDSGLGLGDGSALAGIVYIGILGLAAVGIPMLLITIPCAIVWAIAVGRLVAPGPGSRSA